MVIRVLAGYFIESSFICYLKGGQRLTLFALQHFVVNNLIGIKRHRFYLYKRKTKSTTMNSNKIVTGINTLLEKAGASFRVGVQEPVKMSAETKTMDGVVVATPADEFAEGVEVFVIPAEGGEPVPAPDGIHILEDESTIEVLDGKIVSIKAKVEETEMSDDVRAAVEALAGRVSELEGQLTSANTELSAVKSENETLKTDLAKVKSENAKLAKVPAVSSVKETKREVEKEKTNLSKKAWSQMSQTERVLASLSKN